MIYVSEKSNNDIVTPTKEENEKKKINILY